VKSYRYLIVGGGMTADAAAQGIRESDAKGTIGMVSAEPDPPYLRPALSKSLWKGEPEASVWRGTDQLGVDLALGRTIVALDPSAHEARDDQGETYRFERALLATGGSPRRFDFGSDQIVYFRTLADYRFLRSVSDRGGEFAVIGSGFIGSELAAALAANGRRTTLVFPEETVGARLYPRDLGLFLNDYYRARGVDVLPSHRVVGFEVRGGRKVLRLRDEAGGGEREVVADAVAAGLGIIPNAGLARQAGLQEEDGIRVDEFLRTSAPDIYAAGDVARFYSPALGRHRRVEHEDNANTMGRTAGRNLAGAEERYHHVPFFYSDLFDLGYEAVGEVDSRHEMISDWKEPHREGVVYYLEAGRVRGVLLWNVWGQVDAARALLAEPGPFRREDLLGRLPA